MNVNMNEITVVLLALEVAVAIFFGIWNSRLSKRIDQKHFMPHFAHANSVYVDFDGQMEDGEKDEKNILSKEGLHEGIKEVLNEEFGKPYYTRRGNLYSSLDLYKLLATVESNSGIWISHDPQSSENIFELFIRHKSDDKDCPWELYPAMTVIKFRNDVDFPITNIAINKVIKYEKKEKKFKPRNREELLNVLDISYTSVIPSGDEFFIVIREIYDKRTPEILLCNTKYHKLVFNITLAGGYDKEYDYASEFTFTNSSPKFKLGRIRPFMKFRRKHIEHKRSH